MYQKSPWRQIAKESRTPATILSPLQLFFYFIFGGLYFIVFLELGTKISYTVSKLSLSSARAISHDLRHRATPEWRKNNSLQRRFDHFPLKQSPLAALDNSVSVTRTLILKRSCKLNCSSVYFPGDEGRRGRKYSQKRQTQNWYILSQPKHRCSNSVVLYHPENTFKRWELSD